MSFTCTNNTARTESVNAANPRTPDNPRAGSDWPDFSPTGRPRSATIVITRQDGGVVGA